MHRNLYHPFTAFAALCVVAAQAQVPLPYSTGFDNGAQQAGWEQFRTGVISISDWGVGNSGIAPSPPKILHHDYPVGGASTDTVHDWFVSPLLDLAVGGEIALMLNVYSITGANTPVDELKVMLLTGSNDPELATSVVELAELKDHVSSSPDYVSITGITIPETPGGGYIAFAYQATNNWFVISIDDVTISDPDIGFAEPGASASPLLIYPDPVIDRLDIRGFRPNVGTSLTIIDAMGRRVMQAVPVTGGLDVGQLLSGDYTLLLRDGEAVRPGRFVKR